jgi:hypothetical protein
MEDSALKAATKPRSNPASSATTKRPIFETDSKDSSKQAKKKAPEPSADGVVSPDDTKKSTARDEKKLFQRLWSENEKETSESAKGLGTRLGFLKFLFFFFICNQVIIVFG